MSERQSRRTIVVVDDDEHVRTLLVRALAGTYEVRVAGTAASARRVLQTPPDLLILDVRLGEEDGLNLLADFRRGSVAPVLLITGHGSEAMLARALDLRANAYLAKPFGAPALRARVEQLLAEGPRPEHLADVARRHIETLVRQPVSAEDIATRLGVAPERLLNVFRSRYGCTPIEYLREIRLRHAQHLLVATTLPIAEIAVQSGLHDATYLARLFRRHVGVTPHAFRQAHVSPSPMRSADATSAH